MIAEEVEPGKVENERKKLDALKVKHEPREHKAKANPSKSDRYTTPGEAMQALRVKMLEEPSVTSERMYHCKTCWDSGWEEVDTTGRGTVRRCPRGCDTPRHRAYLASKEAEGS